MRYIAPLFVVLFLLSSCQQDTQRMEQFAVHGIDASHYQSSINWEKVAEQGIDFAFLKATEGEGLKDHRFLDNWEKAAAVGVKRGAYHFFRPSRSALSQALNFTRMVDMQIGDLPPVLDIEVTDDIPKNILLTRMQTWLDLIEMHYRVKPVIYTNQKFYHNYLKGNFEDYPLWIARYSSRYPELPVTHQWSFWQYGDRGKLEGIDGYVDFNVFNGTLEDLSELGYNPPAILSQAY